MVKEITETKPTEDLFKLARNVLACLSAGCYQKVDPYAVTVEEHYRIQGDGPWVKVPAARLMT